MLFLYPLLFLVGFVRGAPGRVGIINGTDAKIENHPWLVALYDDYGQLCGGSLISPEWVLTAGHCGEADPTKILAGTATLDDPNGLYVAIYKIYLHPNYTELDDGSVINDVSLLRLGSPVNGRNYKYIALPEQDAQVPEGKYVNITGWGYDGKDFPSKLKEATVLLTPYEECRAAYEQFHHPVYKNEQFCIGTIGDTKGTCSGDSGGPAEYNGVILGTVSWGEDACSTSGMPAVFANVANYRDWIKEVTGL